MMLNFRAIVFGVALDLLLSLSAGFLLLNFYVMHLQGAGLDDAAIEARIMDPLQQGSFAWLLILVGVLIDAWAGYKTAQRAGFLEYWHGLAMISLLLVIHLGLSGTAIIDSGMELLSILFGVVAALMGAGYAKRKKQEMT